MDIIPQSETMSIWISRVWADGRLVYGRQVYGDCVSYLLGIYATEKRAREIKSEISGLMINDSYYEMPEK